MCCAVNDVNDLVNRRGLHDGDLSFVRLVPPAPASSMCAEALSAGRQVGVSGTEESACLEHMIRLGESEASRSAKRDVEKAKAENNRMKQELEKAKAEIANSPRLLCPEAWVSASAPLLLRRRVPKRCLPPQRCEPHARA